MTNNYQIFEAIGATHWQLSYQSNGKKNWNKFLEGKWILYNSNMESSRSTLSPPPPLLFPSHMFIVVIYCFRTIYFSIFMIFPGISPLRCFRGATYICWEHGNYLVVNQQTYDTATPTIVATFSAMLPRPTALIFFSVGIIQSLTPFSLVVPSGR